MKSTIKYKFLLFLVVLTTNVRAQYSTISVSSFINCKSAAAEYYEEEKNDIGVHFPLEVNKIYVRFATILIDPVRKKAFISGRVCISNSGECISRGGAKIYLAKRRDNKLISKTFKFTTGLAKEDELEDSGGYFDIAFDFEKTISYTSFSLIHI